MARTTAPLALLPRRHRVGLPLFALMLLTASWRSVASAEETSGAAEQPTEPAAVAGPSTQEPTTTGAQEPTPTPTPTATAPGAEVPTASRAEVPTVTAASASAAAPEWTRNLSIGGGAILWYYQPVQSDAKNNIDLFFVNLLFDGHLGDVGLHIEPRVRENKLRPHFGGVNGGTAWLQEAYASFKFPGAATLKVGKEYSHFALFWDNSFYGNVQVYDGLKLDPDYGVSLEGALAEKATVGLRYWAQYFVVDGQTNVALDGRETFSIPGARRRNQAILRLEPFFSVGGRLTVKTGLSGSYLQADLPVLGKKDVYRAAADVTVSVGPWSLWSEFIRQNGQTVTDFPIAGVPATPTTAAVAGHASAHNNYFLVGSELALGKIAVRYNVSYGGYRDLSVSEWLHVPGVAYAVSPNVTFLGEFAYWKRYAPTAELLLDKSANVTLQAHF